MQRSKRSIVGSALLITVLGVLNLGLYAPPASRLEQQPPTDTPTATSTSVPIDTPTPTITASPIPPSITSSSTSTTEPPPATETAIAPTVTPKPTRKSGGGGGAPPGPSGTPVVNGCVESVGKDGVSLSTLPGFYQPHVQVVQRGEILQVLQGPERADTIWWWRLRTSTGVEGWGSQDNITPNPGPCAFGALAATARPSVTSSSAELPRTGSGLDWPIFAGVLALLLVLAGGLRRRLAKN